MTVNRDWINRTAEAIRKHFWGDENVEYDADIVAFISKYLPYPKPLDWKPGNVPTIQTADTPIGRFYLEQWFQDGCEYWSFSLENGTHGITYITEADAKAAAFVDLCDRLALCYVEGVK